jgi:hypothetical protein
MGSCWSALIFQQFLIKGTQLLPLNVAIFIEIYLFDHVIEIIFLHWTTSLIQNVPYYCLKLIHRKMMVVLTVVLSKDLIHSLAYLLVFGSLDLLAVVLWFSLARTAAH